MERRKPSDSAGQGTGAEETYLGMGYGDALPAMAMAWRVLESANRFAAIKERLTTNPMDTDAAYEFYRLVIVEEDPNAFFNLQRRLEQALFNISTIDDALRRKYKSTMEDLSHEMVALVLSTYRSTMDPSTSTKKEFWRIAIRAAHLPRVIFDEFVANVAHLLEIDLDSLSQDIYHIVESIRWHYQYDRFPDLVCDLFNFAILKKEELEFDPNSGALLRGVSSDPWKRIDEDTLEDKHLFLSRFPPGEHSHVVNNALLFRRLGVKRGDRVSRLIRPNGEQVLTISRWRDGKWEDEVITIEDNAIVDPIIDSAGDNLEPTDGGIQAPPRLDPDIQVVRENLVELAEPAAREERERRERRKDRRLEAERETSSLTPRTQAVPSPFDDSEDVIRLSAAARRTLNLTLRDLCGQADINSPVHLAEEAGIDFDYLDLILIGEMPAIRQTTLQSLVDVFAKRLPHAGGREAIYLRIAQGLGDSNWR